MSNGTEHVNDPVAVVAGAVVSDEGEGANVELTTGE